MPTHDYVLIMAGGIGSRFWPLSKNKKPKQFLDVLGTGKTLLQQTYERFEEIILAENIFVVTNDIYKDFVTEQLPKLKESNLLLEPARKNTAPCVAYAAHKISTMHGNANLIVAPADHIILNEKLFTEVLQKAISISSHKEVLLTLGIMPTRPDTGYGYIQYIEGNAENGAFKVKTFVEKPTLEIAKTFYASGDFLWNSGIFVGGVKSWLRAFQLYQPELYDIFQNGKSVYNTKKERAFISKVYTQCTNVSIDIGLMEKAKNVLVIPAKFGWSDLGTWASLYNLHQKDYMGNAVSGKNVVVYDTNNCMVMVPDKKLVVLQGLDDFIVVDSDDVLLITPKNREQEVKQIVADIKRQKGEKYL